MDIIKESIQKLCEKKPLPPGWPKGMHPPEDDVSLGNWFGDAVRLRAEPAVNAELTPWLEAIPGVDNIKSEGAPGFRPGEKLEKGTQLVISSDTLSQHELLDLLHKSFLSSGWKQERAHHGALSRVKPEYESKGRSSKMDIIHESVRKLCEQEGLSVGVHAIKVFSLEGPPDALNSAMLVIQKAFMPRSVYRDEAGTHMVDTKGNFGDVEYGGEISDQDEVVDLLKQQGIEATPMYAG